MSRIGRMPIPVPTGVKVELDGRDVTVAGPKGTLTLTIAEPITIAQDGDSWYVEQDDSAPLPSPTSSPDSLKKQDLDGLIAAFEQVIAELKKLRG